MIAVWSAHSSAWHAGLASAIVTHLLGDSICVTWRLYAVGPRPGALWSSAKLDLSHWSSIAGCLSAAACVTASLLYSPTPAIADWSGCKFAVYLVRGRKDQHTLRSLWYGDNWHKLERCRSVVPGEWHVLRIIAAQRPPPASLHRLQPTRILQERTHLPTALARGILRGSCLSQAKCQALTVSSGVPGSDCVLGGHALCA